MLGAQQPLCPESCRNHSCCLTAAMLLSSPGVGCLSTAFRAWDHLYPQGPPAQSFFAPRKQSHQVTACFSCGPVLLFHGMRL